MVVCEMLSNKLFFIKLIHSTLFLFISASAIYVLYSGIAKNYNWTLFLAIGVVLIEGVVLIFNNWRCPLTTLAKKYGAEKGSVTDIFCPKWFVPHVFQSLTVVFVSGLILLGLNWFI